MRLGWVTLALCACTHEPRAVEIAAPLASATVTTTVNETAVPLTAAHVTASAGGAWAAEFPKAKTFDTYDGSSTNRVLLEWRVGASHVVKRVEGDGEEDYPVNHVAPLDLVVHAGKIERTIALGEPPGSADMALISWCGRTGWHTSSGSWKPANPAIAATFSVGLMQGNDDFAIVRDGATLHVLHEETSDGKCDDAKQGPLDVCEGFEWHLVADVRVAPGVDVWEIATDEGKDLDCGAAQLTERLTK